MAATLFPAIHGFRVNPGVELSDGWTDAELNEIMYSLSAAPGDADLLMESCSGDEADFILNGHNQMVLEAVTAVYTRLPRTMAALARVLNRYLGNGLTVDGEPFIGPDRKNALFAYKVVTFNISDGQTVSVLFHSPDTDPKRFQPDETLIAYRWMLNKRDITASVAPERGRDITLELMARRMAQLIEKNSAKFQEQAAARDARMAELQAAEARREELRNRAAELADEIMSLEDDLLAIQNRASKTAERLTAERARSERLRGAGAVAGDGSDANDYAAIIMREIEAIIPQAQRFERAYSRSQWPKYIKDTLIARNDYLKVFVKSPAVGEMAKIKIALSKAKESADLESIAGKLAAMIPAGNDAAKPDAEDGDGAPARDLPFLMTENGNVTVYAASGTEALPSNWTGIAVDGSDVNSFWYIGFENGERTFNKLQARTLAAAQAEAQALQASAGAADPDKTGTTDGFATTPYADPRTRYAAALAEELAMAGFTPYDFPVNQPDFELGRYSAVASMQMVAGSASVYVESVEAGKAKVQARFSPESQPGFPVPFSPSQDFTFDVPVGVLEGKFDDVVAEISGWLAQFGTAFDNVKLPGFGSKLETDGVNKHDAADIAKRIRQDIKAVLPPGFKPSFISVKTSKYSMGQSIGITVKNVPDSFPLFEGEEVEDVNGGKSRMMTRDARALIKTLEAVANAYRYDNSDAMTDYFDTNFYLSVGYDYDLLNEQKAKEPTPTHHRVLISSPFGNFEVYVAHNSAATADDYKTDAKSAFIADSGIGNGVASVSQVKVVGEPEPVTSVPTGATKAKGAEWALIRRAAGAGTRPDAETETEGQPEGGDVFGADSGEEAKNDPDQNAAFANALRGGNLADALKIVGKMGKKDAFAALLYAGFDVAGNTTKEMLEYLAGDLKLAAEMKTDGFGVRKLKESNEQPGNSGDTGEQTVNEAEAIGQELQKLANGEITDTALFDQKLDELAERAEAAGAMEELDGLLNAAADKLTELLEKEAANVA